MNSTTNTITKTKTKREAEEELVESLFNTICEIWNNSQCAGEDLEGFQEQMGQGFNDECRYIMEDQFLEDMGHVPYRVWKQVWEKLQEVYQH